MKPNKKAFKDVCAKLDEGQQLTLDMVGEVFGQPFWVLVVYSLLDSQEAARAIQGAINRLKAGEASEE